MKVKFLILLILTVFIFPVVAVCGSEESGPITIKDGTSDLVNRVTDGIWRWKTGNGTRKWWSCGVSVEVKESQKIARKWAEIVVSESKKAGEFHGYNLNVWGVVATMSRESAFDVCALGLKPRLWAYKNKLLKVKRVHITHTREELDKLFKNKTFMKKWPRLDLGPGQRLWCKKCTRSDVYNGSLDNIMSLDPGIKLVVEEMVKRVIRHAQKRKGKRLKNKWWYNRPWAFWPGSEPSKVYAKKIQNRAYLLGATKKEFPKLKIN